MSKLDDLIVEFCPDGVEYRRLGGTNGMCEVLPSGIDKVLDENERPVKLCNYMDVYNNQYITDTLIASFMNGSVNDSEYQKFMLRAGQVLLTKDSETKEDIAQSAYVCGDFDDVVCGYHLAALTPKSDIDGKYLNYVLQSHDLRKYFWKMANGVSRFGLKLKSIEDALIPIPPLTVQQEIVRILDTFTALESELESELELELEARKKQYNYYRDELFIFSDVVERLTIGELFDMKAGKSIQASDISSTECDEFAFPCYGGNGLRGYVKQPSHNGKFVIIGRQGALCGNVKRVAGKFYATEHAVVVTAKPGIDIDWAFHTLRTMNLNQYATKSAQPGLSVGKIETITIPVPPLAEQERIAAILDRFDALINDITQGLSAEIEVRRKQYEYYRDKLLTFKEKVS